MASKGVRRAGDRGFQVKNRCCVIISNSWRHKLALNSAGWSHFQFFQKGKIIFEVNYYFRAKFQLKKAPSHFAMTLIILLQRKLPGYLVEHASRKTVVTGTGVQNTVLRAIIFQYLHKALFEITDLVP